MGTQDDRRVTVLDLARLAGTVGLCPNTDEGRSAFTAWMARDPKPARKAIFDRVEARRVAASADQHPVSWLKRTTPATPVVAATVAAPSKDYPAGWLRAAGIRRGSAAKATRNLRTAGVRITEAGD